MRSLDSETYKTWGFVLGIFALLLTGDIITPTTHELPGSSSRPSR